MFINKLNKFVDELKAGNDVDEWYLASFINENVIELSEDEAFGGLVYVLSLIKNDLNSTELYEYLQISISLHKQSATNQIPLILIECPDFFKNILDFNTEDYIVNSVNELKNLYRL